jgi:hypothetical protein
VGGLSRYGGGGEVDGGKRHPITRSVPNACAYHPGHLMHTPFGGLLWNCCGLPGYQTRQVLNLLAFTGAKVQILTQQALLPRQGAKPTATDLVAEAASRTHSSASACREAASRQWGCKRARTHMTRQVPVAVFLAELRNASASTRSRVLPPHLKTLR